MAYCTVSSSDAASLATKHVRCERKINISRRRRHHQTISPRHPIMATAFLLILSTALNQCTAAAPSISGTQSGVAAALRATQGNNSDGAAVVSSSLTHHLWGGHHGDDTKEWMVVPHQNIGSRLLQVVEEDDHEGDDHDHEEVAAVDEVVIEGAAVVEEIVTEAVAAVEEEHHDEEHHDEDEHDEDEHDEDEHLNEKDHDEHDDHGAHDDHDHGHEVHDDHDHGHEAHADEFNTSTTSNESKANNSGGEPWGAVIGATLLVNVATFSGVLLLVLPAMYRGVLKYRNIPIASSPAANGNGSFFDIVIPGFAVGALIATAVFLVLPESIKYLSGDAHAGHADGEDDHAHRHLQEDSHAGEGSAAAKFGCSVLGGFLLPFAFAILFHHQDPAEEGGHGITKESREGSVAVINEEEDCESCVERTDDVEIGVAVAKEEDASPLEETTRITETGRSDAFQDSAANTPTTPDVNKRLCATILLGDSFHNLADGFFIAAAFHSCSVAVAISIMLVTLFHEIAQELADFIVLTKFAKLPVWKALAFNFISGLTVCLGGIIFLAATPTDAATGVILAMAGGVYINIAACETAPRMEAAMKGRGDRVLMLFSIILGTIPIGLILLDHKHCG
eukprot:scaffold3803_cov151-Skeletonema_menzelii.AAC.2